MAKAIIPFYIYVCRLPNGQEPLSTSIKIIDGRPAWEIERHGFRPSDLKLPVHPNEFYKKLAVRGTGFTPAEALVLYFIASYCIKRSGWYPVSQPELRQFMDSALNSDESCGKLLCYGQTHNLVLNSRRFIGLLEQVFVTLEKSELLFRKLFVTSGHREWCISDQFPTTCLLGVEDLI